MVSSIRTAVIVIDVVRDFTDPAGKVHHAAAADIVPRIDWELDNVRAHCEDGTFGVELAPPLAPHPDDYVFTKRRYSAFVGTDLDLILRDNRIETVVLAGTKTNVCIRATAQDAFEHNYRVLVPRDLVSTDKPHLHEANLEDIGKYMGRVTTADEALALLAQEETIR
jgi:nicotinamidase-related amidase